MVSKEQMNTKKRDLVIIGSGPAGLSAAIYAKRAMLDVVVIEKEYVSGGQVINSGRIDNYLGYYGISGFDLSEKFRAHADALSVAFAEGEVTKIIIHGKKKEVYLGDDTIIRTNALIVATGAKHRLLDIPGEKEFLGAGVSYCATCDGMFFENREVAVVGGGDTALEEALYLAKICKKVSLIHRRDEFRGTKILQEQVLKTKNINFFPHTEVKSIKGKNIVEEIEVFQNQTNEIDRIKVNGVFIAAGMEPVNELVKDLVLTDNKGYVVAGEDCRTNIPGVYVAGDIRTKNLRQIITAVSDGALAIRSLEEDLERDNLC